MRYSIPVAYRDPMMLASIVFAIALVLMHAIGLDHLLPLAMGAHGMTWIGAARKRNQILGSIANDAGQRVPRRMDLRNAGYLDRLFLLQYYDFQFGVANPTAADAFGQAGGQIDRLTLQSNSVGLLFDCSGEMTKVISAIDDAQRIGSANLDPAPNRFNAAPALAANTNVWAAQIPIAVYFNNKPWPIGLYQMALNALEVSLEARFRPLLGTTATTNPGQGVYVPAGTTTTVQAIRGDLQVQQQYFDPIADPASQPTLAFVHQWREFSVPIGANGDIDLRLPPSNLYMRMIYWLVTGAANALAPDATSLTKLQLRYGANFAPFEETAVAQFTNGLSNINRGGQVTQRQARLYDNMFGLATAGAYDGVYVHDFFTDNDNEQDFINSAATTDLRSTLTLSGATVSGGAYVKVAAEQLIPLVVPSPGAGNVQGVS